jgi:uncharacterized protein DUF4953/uncharacterized protein DUF5117
MHRYSSALAAMLVAAVLAACAAAPAGAAGKPPGKAGEGAGEKDKPYGEWKKVTKDAEIKRGFFTLYQKRENLYLELKPEQLDKPVLGIFSLARGIGKSFVLGGLPINDRLLEFHREGDRVLVMEKNMRFTAPAGSPIEKAKDLSHGNSVIAALKIESVHDSSKALLVDLAPFLVSDITDMAEGMRSAFNNKPVRFDKERSALSSVKVFPENVEIEALLTYSPSDRQNLNLNTVPDDRYVPVTMHYSFTRLPEVPMQPRLADDRTGFFVTAKKDFSRDEQENFWVRYVERWRLEKKDPSATLSEPVKPIVFYVDHTIPEKYRPAIKQGIEAWQKAFEAAGFKNAIVAKDAPNDPDWDPEDVRYSTIRWITSSEPSFGAIGPSRVDPRTGEILDADILFEASIVQRRWRIYRDLVGGPSAIAEGVVPRLGPAPPFVDPDRRCEAALGMPAGLALVHLGLLADGSLPPGSPLQEKFTNEMLVHTTLHEVGHTLGLTHNFRASTATPYDKLHDPEWTRANGLMSSVMDYATPNIALDGAQQGDYYGRVPGTADVWMIRYGYTPSKTADVAADYAFAEAIADESTRPEHPYSNDADTYPADALDPRTAIWDLGSDPLRFARERTGFIRRIWKSGKLDERILGPEGEYPVVRRAMDGLLEQYGIALGLSVKWVGGQYQSRSHRGQPDAVDPLRPIPAAKQREALDFLAENAFATDAFAVDRGLLNRLAPDRWLHWGVDDNFGVWTGPRLDYDLNGKVRAIQNALLGALTQPALLARLREAESHTSEPFRLSEHFDRMTRMLWSEVGGASPAALQALEGPHTRRELQRAWVDRMAQLVVNPPAGLPDDARALARLQLVRIDSRAARSLASGVAMGDNVRAHLLESRARIERALHAQREADAARPAGGPSALD